MAESAYPLAPDEFVRCIEPTPWANKRLQALGEVCKFSFPLSLTIAEGQVLLPTIGRKAVEKSNEQAARVIIGCDSPGSSLHYGALTRRTWIV